MFLPSLVCFVSKITQKALHFDYASLKGAWPRDEFEVDPEIFYNYFFILREGAQLFSHSFSHDAPT